MQSLGFTASPAAALAATRRQGPVRAGKRAPKPCSPCFCGWCSGPGQRAVTSDWAEILTPNATSARVIHRDGPRRVLNRQACGLLRKPLAMPR